MKIVGVTGTNGKTSCVEMICNLLKEKINCASFGTLGIKNYGKGLLLFEVKTKLTTLGNIELKNNLRKVADHDCRLVAMEVSSHGLDQKRVSGVDFSDVVFTNLSHDHLDYHKSMKNYFHAKLKLFTDHYAKLTRAIINLDDFYGLKIIKHLLNMKNDNGFPLEIIGFTTNPIQKQSKKKIFNFIKVISCDQIMYNKNGMRAKIISPWGVGYFKINLLGLHNLSNLLPSIAISINYLSFDEIIQKVENLKPVVGRLQKVDNDINAEVIIDYAHTPDGLDKALLAITKHYPNKLICCIFGCGGDRDPQKRPKMLKVADRYCNSIIITQDNPRSEDPKKIIEDILKYKTVKTNENLIVEMDRKKAIYMGVQKYYKDHIIFIAGKGHENSQIIGDQEFPFCDYTIAKEAILGCNFLFNSYKVKEV